MTTSESTTALSAGISAATAWSAFDRIIHQTDWRLRIASLNPFKLWVEGDEDFDRYRSLGSSWKSQDQALAWIARRIDETTGSINSSDVRRMHLQMPNLIDDPYSEAFLDGLQTRVRNTVRTEIAAYFDTSLAEWEADANRHADTIENVLEHRRFKAFVGLDQLVSDDACRKALKFLAHRTHWHIAQGENGPALVEDYLFQGIMDRRHSHEETARARCLVARAAEAMFANHLVELRAGSDVKALTKVSIMTELTRRFRTDGVWGLIHTVLPHDRQRTGLSFDDLPDERARAIIRHQDPWLIRARAV